MTWTLADIPDLTGRRALVTGVTAGIGESTALELARHGASVILAARSKEKLSATRTRILDVVPSADLEDLHIDLSEQESVRRAATRVSGPLHLLVNNAGVMATPYHRTTDGFELQLATNHLGPFALTGLLLPHLIEGGSAQQPARVVAVASLAHRMAIRPPTDDPRKTGRYHRWPAYAKSKLADLLFTYELDRRLAAAGQPVIALAAHPGYAATDLITTGQGTGPIGTIMDAATKVLGQPAEYGALPTLMAATADLPGSSYVGPSGAAEMRGLPRLVGSSRLAKSRAAQARLWEISESATGIRYP